MRKIVVLLTLSAAALTACHRSPAADPRVLPTFNQVAALLDELAAASPAVVPDAVLNRARCVAVIPKTTGGKAAPGALSCRDDSQLWQKPSLVRYLAQPHPSGDVLIFILGERAIAQLNDGHLDL